MSHANDNRGPCAHCAINRAIDEFNAAHSPVDVDVLIDDVTAVLCELIAIYGGRNERRAEVKEIASSSPNVSQPFVRQGGILVARHPASLRSTSWAGGLQICATNPAPHDGCGASGQ